MATIDGIIKRMKSALEAVNDHHSQAAMLKRQVDAGPHILGIHNVHVGRILRITDADATAICDRQVAEARGELANVCSEYLAWLSGQEAAARLEASLQALADGAASIVVKKSAGY